jgi:hypothetical protein
MKNKIILLIIIFTLLLAPLQSLSKTILNNDKAEENDIKSSKLDLTKILWKLNKQDNSKFSNLLANENQKTKDVFDNIISANSEDDKEDYPKIIDFLKTDEIISDSDQEEDDYFESETWAWYKQRLGWLLEASEVINDFINETLDIICELKELPEQYLSELQQTIDYLTSMIHYWKEGVFYLESLKLDVLKQKFEMFKEELNNYIEKIQEATEDIKEEWDDIKEELAVYFESEPWKAPVFIDCNIKDVKGLRLEIAWGRLFDTETGSDTIPVSSVINNEAHYQITFDTSDLDDKGTQYLAQYFWVRVNKSNDVTEKVSETRFFWAFSNASVELDFFSDDDDTSRDLTNLFQKLIHRYPILFRLIDKIGLINKLIN